MEGETAIDAALEETNVLSNGISVPDDAVNMLTSDATDVLAIQNKSSRSNPLHVQEAAAASADAAAAETAAFAAASPSAPAQTVAEGAVDDAVPAEWVSDPGRSTSLILNSGYEPRDS